MNISYKRTTNTSYMIIDQGILPNGYEEQMLRENDISSLLPFYTTNTNGNLSYWYDITGKISLADYYKRSGVDRATLLAVFRGLAIALREASKYLIPQDHILITPETVYLKDSGQQPFVYLCFYPSGDNPGGMIALMEHLIGIVDHGMEQERRLCYDLYDMSVRPETTIASLIEKIEESDVSASAVVETSDRCIQIHMKDDCYDTGEISSDVYTKKDLIPIKAIDTEKEKRGNPFERLIKRVKELFDKTLHMRSDKLLPDEATDLIYEPDASFYEPTVMMGRSDMPLEGRLIYEGSGNEEDIRILSDECRIGSMVGENDAVIRSPAVSRHHALITQRDGAYYIEDMNSTNGTYLNEKLLVYHEPVKLSYADHIRFADKSYRFV